MQSTKSAYNTCVASLAAERNSYDKLIYDKQNWDKFISDNEDQLSDIAENLFTTGDYEYPY